MMRRMMRKLKSLHGGQDGSVFIEAALLIIGVALAVAPFMTGLGSVLSGKVDEIRAQVEQVGI
jgi:Flp pilus assembly pilin Flp